ncbi:MAG: ribose-phosphate pyrophosphokinase [Candidatus Kerfeldbacteria bacterium]|nr:ribose-phosphate pyrophosphokinase [Candidatus Kerfeldbacteria bacterium]
MNSKKVIISGSGAEALARKTAEEAGVPFGTTTLKTFSDGETYVRIHEDVKDAEVFCFQSGQNPANTHLVQLCMLIDAARRNGAKRVITITPFYPYRRQDRQVEIGESVGGHVAAKCIEAAGADEVVMVDMHHARIREFFTVPVTELTAFPLFARYIKEHEDTHFMVVLAPDLGSINYAEHFMRLLHLPLIQVTKKRTAHDKAKVVNLDGDVSGKDVLIVDDEVNTAGTFLANIDELQKRGARSVILAVTHPVLSGAAIGRFDSSLLKKILITDSIPLPSEKKIPKMEVLSVAPVIADFIRTYAHR